ASSSTLSSPARSSAVSVMSGPPEAKGRPLSRCDPRSRAASGYCEAPQALSLNAESAEKAQGSRRAALSLRTPRLLRGLCVETKRLRRSPCLKVRGHDAAMRIATFNINNVVKRLANLTAWLEATRPDVVCLQELKQTDAGFPAAELEAAGYRAVWAGQRSWNGVAILARDD